MNEAFRVHMLNEQGKAKAKRVAEAFQALVDELQDAGVALGQSLDPNHQPGPKTRCGSLVLTKLEEACFFAKKDVANSPENCEP